MTDNDNTPQSQAVPMDDFAWGQNIGLKRDVLYRRWWIGPGEHDVEYREATEAEIATGIEPRQTETDGG